MDLIYDAGELIAAERRSADLLALHDETLRRGVLPMVPVAARHLPAPERWTDESANLGAGQGRPRNRIPFRRRLVRAQRTSMGTRCPLDLASLRSRVSSEQSSASARTTYAAS